MNAAHRAVPMLLKKRGLASFTSSLFWLPDNEMTAADGSLLLLPTFLPLPLPPLPSSCILTLLALDATVAGGSCGRLCALTAADPEQMLLDTVVMVVMRSVHW